MIESQPAENGPSGQECDKATDVPKERPKIGGGMRGMRYKQKRMVQGRGPRAPVAAGSNAIDRIFEGI